MSDLQPHINAKEPQVLARTSENVLLTSSRLSCLASPRASNNAIPSPHSALHSTPRDQGGDQQPLDGAGTVHKPSSPPPRSVSIKLNVARMPAVVIDRISRTWASDEDVPASSQKHSIPALVGSQRHLIRTLRPGLVPTGYRPLCIPRPGNIVLLGPVGR